MLWLFRPALQPVLLLLLLVVALVGGALSPASWAAGPPTGPQLRLETGAHTASVNRLSVAGSVVATASDDKTVRLWSAASGEAQGIVRVPIGQGSEGALYAVALSPDGSLGVAGGLTCTSWDGSPCLYVFDPRTGRLRGRFPRLPDAVNYLAFSPDGHRLVAGLGGTSGIAVFDVPAFKPVPQEPTYGDRVTWVAFDGAGRFATASFDGFLRLYDQSGRLIGRPRPAPGGKRPFSVAFSPDSTLLAVGYADRDRVDVLSAQDLSPRYVATAGKSQGASAVVAWSGPATSPVLNAAGTLRDRGGSYLLRRWPEAGKGSPVEIAIASDTINDLKALPDGGLAFASGDASWGSVDQNGALKISRKALIDDLSATIGRGIAVGAGGGIVEFATARGGQGIMRFDLGRRSLDPVSSFDPSLSRAPAPGTAVPVRNWEEGTAPTINGRPVALDKEERTHSMAVVANRRQILLGSDYYLRLYDQNGSLLGKADTPSGVWGLAVDPAQTVAVAALRSGTIRWFSLSPGRELQPLLTLFPASDGQRWIAWTPEGFFDHADIGGKELVGYQVNRGPADNPEWINFAQLYRNFYAPELLAAKLAGQDSVLRARMDRTGDATERLAEAALPRIEILATCPVATSAGAPQASATCQRPTPKSGGIGQAATVAAGTDRLMVQFRIVDQGGGVGAIDFFNNDRNIGRAQTARELQSVDAAAAPGDTGPNGRAPAGLVLEREVALDPGRNAVVIRAYNGSNGAYALSSPLELQASSPPRPVSDKPRLFILAAAVNDYKPPVPKLDLAVEDAKTFVRSVADHSGGIFAPEPMIIELYNDDATSDAIDRGFDRIAAEAQTRDTVLIYLAGHGSMINDKYYFVPREFDLGTANTEDQLNKTLQTSAYTGERLVEHLGRVKARNGFVFLDTCHSGALTLDAGASQINHESGRYVLTASASVELALDSYDGHNGLLAYAIKEALSKARPDSDGRIDNFTLGFYVSKRVGELAATKHHEQSAHFKIATNDAQPFPIAETR